MENLFPIKILGVYRKLYALLVLSLAAISTLSAQKLPLFKEDSKAQTISTINIKEIEQKEKDFFEIVKKKKKVENEKLFRTSSKLKIPADAKGKTFQFKAESSRSLDQGPVTGGHATGAGFLALDDNNTMIPPDCAGAVGLNHVMTALNSEVRIQEKSGKILSTFSLNGFFSDARTKVNVFDPRLIYDPFYKRWIFVALANSKSDSSKLLIAISSTEDPLSSWTKFSYLVDDEKKVWLDYLNIGFNKNWIVISGNIFDIEPYEDKYLYKGADIYIFNKEALYEGLDQADIYYVSDKDGFTISPAVTLDNSLETEYLVCSYNPNENGTGYLRLYTITGTPSKPQFSITNIFPNVDQGWADLPPPGFLDFAPQKNVQELIMNNDSRIQNVVYSNGSVWCTQTVFVPGASPSQSAVQWWQINPKTGDVLQFGRIQDATKKIFYAFPSIAVNSLNDLVIGYASFSSGYYATMCYSYRMHTDPSNKTRKTEQIKPGIGEYYKSFSGDQNRWGDYTTTCIDPDGKSFWILGEFSEAPDKRYSDYGIWGTYWYRLILP